MPSDAKKKRDLQKKAAAKQRQAPGKKSNTTTGAGNDPIDDDLIENNDDNDSENGNESPAPETNGINNDVDPNVKSLIQNLDLLSMVEKANADARACTGNKKKVFLSFKINFLFFYFKGVLGSHPRGRDIHINQFSVTFYGQEILVDADFEMNCGRRYGLAGLNGSGKSTILACIGNREVKNYFYLKI